MDNQEEYKAKILIVDDDVLIGESTKFLLKKANYGAVGIATSAKEALESAKEKHPDLILMDVNLGEKVDGITAASEIQKFADIPFIFLTAYTDTITVSRVKEISPYGYLIKPYDNKELLIAIETALYKHSYDKKIKEQEMMFRTISNYAYEWEFWLLPDSSFKYCSPSCERVTGYTSDEFIANPKLQFEIVHTEDTALFEDHYRQYHNHRMEETVKTLQFRIIDKEGSIKYIRHTCSPITDAQNNYHGRRVTNVDITESKLYENSLKESEERFRAIFENNILPMFLIDPENNLKIVNVNEAACSYYGYSRQEFLKSISADVFNVGTKEETINRMRATINEKRKYIVVQHKLSNGQIRDVEIFISLVPISGKTLILSIVNDITEVKKQRETLVKLSVAIASSPTSIVITDTEGIIEYVNPAFTEITGFTFEEAFNQNPKILKSGVQDIHFYENLWNSIKNGLVWRGELVNKKKNGELYIERATISPIRNDKSEIINFIALKENITEEKKAQNELEEYKKHLEDLVEKRTAELKASIERFKYLGESSKDSIFRIDENLSIQYMNSAMKEKWTIRENDNILDALMLNNVSEKLKNIITESLLETFKSKNIVRRQIFHKNEFWIDWVFIPEFNSSNKVETVLGFGRDITEIKKLNESILVAYEKEKELNEIKTNFISMTSHEFRTPLTSILSSADLLELYHNNGDKSKVLTHINRIQNSVLVLSSLLDEVLTLSRSDRGKIEFNPKQFDLNDFCLEILDQIKVQTLENQKIIYDYKLPFKNIIGDSKILNHIISNLLSNAIKYSPEGGDVYLSVEEENEFIKFTVKDNGIGIPEEDQKKLFEPFFRARNSDNVKGYGLGLSIVKRYVEIHKGEIYLESKLNEGSKFTVKIKKIIN